MFETITAVIFLHFAFNAKCLVMSDKAKYRDYSVPTEKTYPSGSPIILCITDKEYLIIN